MIYRSSPLILPVSFFSGFPFFLYFENNPPDESLLFIPRTPFYTPPLTLLYLLMPPPLVDRLPTILPKLPMKTYSLVLLFSV